jgi:two-component system CheB/CheR fusion protein
MQSSLFTTVDSKLKIFRRKNSGPLPVMENFPSSFSRTKTYISENPKQGKSDLNIQTQADRLLLQFYSPSAVFVNDSGDIVYIYGHTGKYLEPAVGKANLNIYAMLRESLRNEFHHAFNRAVSKKESVGLRNGTLEANGKKEKINIDIKWIEKPEILLGFLMVIFTDIVEIPEIHLPAGINKKAFNSIRQTELENELKRLREEMQGTLEEVQTGQEELRSTNEELQSTNEELQSANEELTTSKEEMQSLNEELQTVNAELQAKVDDYSRINNDMKNLLNSTELATLFLDKELNIRRYTIQATKIFKLIKSDIGRPFTDQVTDLIYSGLSEDAIEVLRTLVYIQKEIPAKDGRWFLVRVMPYRTFDDRIDGIVITFINITEQKKIESRLKETGKLNKLLLSASRDVKVLLSGSYDILELNPKAEKFFGKSRENCLNQNFIQKFVPEKEQKGAEATIKMLLSTGSKVRFKMNLVDAKGNISKMNCFLTLSHQNQSTAESMILSIINQRTNEEERSESYGGTVIALKSRRKA